MTLRRPLRILLACVLAAVPMAARAVDVACVSFLADRVGVVEQERAAGTGTNTAKRRGGAVSVQGKDDIVTKAALVGLTERNPAIEVITLQLSGAAIAPLQALVLSSVDDPRVESLRPVARQIAQQAHARYVLVLAKLEFRHWSSPYVLDGVGVFGDATMVRREDNYVAPYIGAAMLLLDAAGEVRERRAIVAHAEYRASVEHQERADSPWDILSDAELDRHLDELIAQEVRAAAKTLALEH